MQRFISVGMPSILVLGLGLSLGTSASAEEPHPGVQPEAAAASNIKGKFRVHIDGRVLGYGRRQEWREDEFDATDDSHEWVDHEVGMGVGTHKVGIGFGFGITDGLIVGGKLAMGMARVKGVDKDRGEDEPDGIYGFTSYLLLPYVEYAFIPGGRVRPFVLGALGLSGNRETASDTDDVQKVVVHRVSPVVAVAGGVHLFVIPQASIDIMGEFQQSWNKIKVVREIDGAPNPADPDPEYLREDLVTELGVNAGISIWF